MARTYTTLTTEARAQIKQERIAQYEREHYSHELNKRALASLPNGAEKDRALADANAAQATIERAITALEKPATP